MLEKSSCLKEGTIKAHGRTWEQKKTKEKVVIVLRSKICPTNENKVLLKRKMRLRKGSRCYKHSTYNSLIQCKD